MSAICFNLDQPKILSSGNGLKDAKMMISVINRIENIITKAGIAGYQHFLLFPHYVLALSQTSPGLHVSEVQVFLKHCAKRRN